MGEQFHLRLRVSYIYILILRTRLGEASNATVMSAMADTAIVTLAVKSDRDAFGFGLSLTSVICIVTFPSFPTRPSVFNTTLN